MSEGNLFLLPSIPKELQFDTSGEVVFRALKTDDIDKGFLTLLSQLTSAPDITTKQYLNIFEKMKKRLS